VSAPRPAMTGRRAARDTLHASDSYVQEGSVQAAFWTGFVPFWGD
jgi:hypothetical protein